MVGINVWNETFGCEVLRINGIWGRLRKLKTIEIDGISTKDGGGNRGNVLECFY